VWPTPGHPSRPLGRWGDKRPSWLPSPRAVDLVDFPMTAMSIEAAYLAVCNMRWRPHHSPVAGRLRVSVEPLGSKITQLAEAGRYSCAETL
jgi:hypothetical protein